MKGIKNFGPVLQWQLINGGQIVWASQDKGTRLQSILVEERRDLFILFQAMPEDDQYYKMMEWYTDRDDAIDGARKEHAGDVKHAVRRLMRLG